MTTALIDGDIAAYRASAAVFETIDLGDGQKATLSDAQAAARIAVDICDTWRKLAKCTRSIVCFSGRANFRKVVLPSYKSNRRGASKPPAYLTTVAAIQDRFDWRLENGLEGDDLLGILLTTDRFIGSAICLTADKDLRTVAGRHMNPLKETAPVAISEAEGDRWWLTQTLTGDTSDGYVGIPGIGAKKAAVILAGHEGIPALWPRVVTAYANAKLTETDALTQARVARILRRPDYDKSTKEVLLWHPSDPVRLSLASVVSPLNPTP